MKKGVISQEQINEVNRAIQKKEGRKTRGDNQKPLISHPDSPEDTKNDQEVKKIINILEKAGYEIVNKINPAPAIPAPPTIKDREIALKELELKTIQNYSGDRHQNTHISEDQRLLLSILFHDVATNPYPSSRDYAKKHNIPWNDKDFLDQSLIDFLADYIDFGLPVEREGRKEVGRVLESYFNRDRSKDKHEEPIIN